MILARPALKRKASIEADTARKRASTPGSQQSSPLSSLPSTTPSPPGSVRESSKAPPLIQQVIRQTLRSKDGGKQEQLVERRRPRSQPNSNAKNPGRGNGKQVNTNGNSHTPANTRPNRGCQRERGTSPPSDASGQRGPTPRKWSEWPPRAAGTIARTQKPPPLEISQPVHRASIASVSRGIPASVPRTPTDWPALAQQQQPFFQHPQHFQHQNVRRPPLSPSKKEAESSNSLVFRLIEERNTAMVEVDASPRANEYFRRNLQVSSIMQNVNQAFADQKPDEPEMTPRQPPTPSFKDLALSKLRKANTRSRSDPPLFCDHAPDTRQTDELDTRKDGCTFCLFECDYGISDERVWLPIQAGNGYCSDCHNSAASFYGEWQQFAKLNIRYATVAQVKRLDQLDKMSNVAPLKEADEMNGSYSGSESSGSSQRNRVLSSIDGRDTTKFQGVLFCKGCPWRQIDVRKARICEDCKWDKFMIVRHRHKGFLPIEVEGEKDFKSQEGVVSKFEDDEEKIFKGRGLRRCMVCTGCATHICDSCPLRVCAGCQTLLTRICKGWLDNLFYHFDRLHIRNDAFLLRSDGGGF